MSTQQTQQPVGSAQWANLQKKKKGPLKISAIKKMEVGLTDDSNRLKEPVVIAITCGEYSQQLVLHRPVGATKLQPGDWILTPIAEVESLLASAVDPAKDKKETAKRNMRMSVAITLGLYVKDKDGVIGFPAGAPKEIAGKPINFFNAEARRLHDEAAKRARDEYIAECTRTGKVPKKDWKFGQTVNHFLPKEVKDYEETTRKKVAESPGYVDGLKKIEPVPYETMAGPYQDRPQCPVHGPGKIDASPELMVDLVKKHLINTMTGGYQFPLAPPAKALSAVKNGGTDPQKVAAELAEIFFAKPPAEKPA